MAKTEEEYFKEKAKKAALKACRCVEKMVREEPHPIFVSDGDGTF